MRILILDQYYPQFLQSFYKGKTKKSGNYEKIKTDLINTRFGTSDFYSHALKTLGFQAEEVIVNDRTLQKLWLEKSFQNVKLSLCERLYDQILDSSKFLSARLMNKWEEKVLYQQIKSKHPDVLYIQNIGYVNPSFLRSIKNDIKLIVGQIASPIPPFRDYKVYDLIVTSFPHYVKRFQKIGINSSYLKLAFDKRVLLQLPKAKRKYDVTFVGGISRAHKKGFELLNRLADSIKLDVWGYGKDELDKKSNLYKYHHGPVWGMQMYRVLSQSKITINRHIDVAENYANNMRLYEATGCGAMLITDDKKNLKDIFKVGKEVVSYKNINDLIALVNYYLKHDKERVIISKAGQKRTLSDHTYEKRMRELVDILYKNIIKSSNVKNKNN